MEQNEDQNTQSPDRKIFALVRDLMFSARISAEAKAAGIACKIVRDPAQLLATGEAEFLLVDLSLPGSMEAAAQWKKAFSRPIIGFAPHVETDLIHSANAAGFDQVLTRGKFVAVLPRLLEEALRGRSG